MDNSSADNLGKDNLGEDQDLPLKRSPLESAKDADIGGLSLVHHQRTEVSYSGPLPPPGVLAEFERILPGAAERIFTMAEKQLEHRQSLEKTVIESGRSGPTRAFMQQF